VKFSVVIPACGRPEDLSVTELAFWLRLLKENRLGRSKKFLARALGP
jgi:hypothetical protein